MGFALQNRQTQINSCIYTSHLPHIHNAIHLVGSTYPDLVCLSFVMSSTVTNAKSIITPAKEQISIISLICSDESTDLSWSPRQSVKFSHSYQLTLLV